MELDQIFYARNSRAQIASKIDPLIEIGKKRGLKRGLGGKDLRKNKKELFSIINSDICFYIKHSFKVQGISIVDNKLLFFLSLTINHEKSIAFFSSSI